MSDLLREPGHRRAVEVAAPVDWALELARVDPDVPLRVHLVLESIVGGIVARGRVAVVAWLTCRRCLTEWSEPLYVDFLEVLSGDTEAEYRLRGDEADLEPPLRDAVLLALPLRPICRPDCLGLCAVCGGDLNTGSCPGHDEGPGSPFAPLRDLLQP